MHPCVQVIIKHVAKLTMQYYKHKKYLGHIKLFIM